MSYLNILIGLGGTGVEVLNDYLKIVNRYPHKNNKFEWFVLDSASLETKFSFLNKDKTTRFVQLEGFNSSRDVLLRIKEKYPESNISDIFPDDDFLAKEDISSHGGAWEIRKLGFLLLLYHLIKSENNIFDKIINSLSKYPLNFGDIDDGGGISGIKIFIINSIAGGTGSGLFLPFAGFLKDLVKKRVLEDLDEFPLNIYSFLALPNFVAKGNRAPHSESTNHKYKANAYESLKEIETLFSKRMNWSVKLSDDYQFDFSPTGKSLGSQSSLVDNFFLFNDVNIARKDIVIPNVTGKADEYRPYFQEMAWCIYLMSSGDNAYYQNGPGNDLNKKGFAGIGVLPLEFPKETLLDRMAQTLFGKTPIFFNSFSSKRGSDLTDSAKAFKPSLFSFLGESQKLFSDQLREYKYDLSAIGGKNIQSIQDKQPIPLKYDANPYFRKYTEEANSKIQELLVSKFSIIDIYSFLKEFREIIENENKKNLKELNFLNDKKKTTVRDIKSQKKYKELLKYQADLFTQEFRLQNLESYFDLLTSVIADIDQKLRFFSSYLILFSNDSIFGGFRIKINEYFEFPPPFTEIGYDEEELNKLQTDILNEILSEYHPAGQNLSSDDYEKELLKKIWEDFSINFLNNTVEIYFKKYFSNKIEEFNANDFMDSSQKDLYESWYNFIKKFIALHKDKFISKRNTLVKSFNDGGLVGLGLSYPFIPLKSLVTGKQGKKAIFCNQGAAKLLKGTSSLGGYEQATKYDVLDTDCLLLISSLVADKKIDDLELSAMETSYKIMLKEDEKNRKKNPPEPSKYVFIDPRFGGNI